MNTDTAYRYEDLPRLMSLMTGDEKHSSAATSTLDVLWTLYDRVLRVDPTMVDDERRDRFILSKGHGPMAFYAVLAANRASSLRIGSRRGPASTPRSACIPIVC